MICAADIPRLAIDRGPYLAKAHAVAPACAVEDEPFRGGLAASGNAHDEGAAVEMAAREPAPYLQLFAHDHAHLRADDPEPPDAARRTAASGTSARRRAEIEARLLVEDLLQLLPGIFDGPAEKGFRLPVEGGEDFFQDCLVFRIAVGAFAPTGASWRPRPRMRQGHKERARRQRSSGRAGARRPTPSRIPPYARRTPSNSGHRRPRPPR